MLSSLTLLLANGSVDEVSNGSEDEIGRDAGNALDTGSGQQRSLQCDYGIAEAWAHSGIVDMRAAQSDQGLDDGEPHMSQSTSPTSARQSCEEVLMPSVLT